MIKRITAGILALLLAFSMTGCYSEDKSWAMKQGDHTMSIGSYIYYLYLGYYFAVEEVTEGQEVLKATIDGKKAEDWIRARTYQYAQTYFWLDNKTKEYGLELTEEELSSAEAATANQWQYLGQSLEAQGVSEASFTKAYSEYNIKYKKIFEKLYSEGGAFALSKDEVLSFYQDNKYTYAFLFSPLTKSNEENEAADLSEDEKKALKEKFDAYKKQVESDEITLEDAAQDYAKSLNLENAPYNSFVNSKSYENYPTDFVKNLEEMKPGQLRCFESENNLVLLQKLDIAEAAKKMVDSPEDYLTTMLEMKGEEFADYLNTTAAKEITDLNVNSAAINGIKISSFVSDDNKLGTKTA